MMTTHSPEPAALAPDDPELLVVVEALDDPEPDWIETDGPLDPIDVLPLRPPGPVLIVVELVGEPLPDRDECFDDLLDVVSFCATRQGLLLSMTIVVPPLLPVTIETVAPPPLVLVVLSARTAGASAASVPARSVVAKSARIMDLL